jgi:hypothetical protein
MVCEPSAISSLVQKRSFNGAAGGGDRGCGVKGGNGDDGGAPGGGTSGGGSSGGGSSGDGSPGGDGRCGFVTFPVLSSTGMAGSNTVALIFGTTRVPTNTTAEIALNAKKSPATRIGRVFMPSFTGSFLSLRP